MTETDNDWIRVLNLARINAAQDLSMSQELLNLVDDLVALSDKETVSVEALAPIRDELIKIAVKLSDQPKQISIAISKLMGVI